MLEGDEGREKVVDEPRVLQIPVTRSTQVHTTRTQLKMTQFEFAQFMCIKVDTLKAWEDGTEQPDPLSIGVMQALQYRLASNPFQAPAIVTMAKSFKNMSNLLEHLLTVWATTI